MGLQHYTQDMSRIPLKYNINVLFYTKYTHPTLICRRRTDGRKIFTQYSGISSHSMGARIFRMLFNLSGCSSAEDSCNLHALLPYFSYSCMNIFCLSCVHLPLFILLIGKLADATFPDPKRTRHRKQFAMTSNCHAQQPMECL